MREGGKRDGEEKGKEGKIDYKRLCKGKEKDLGVFEGWEKGKGGGFVGIDILTKGGGSRTCKKGRGESTPE